MKRFILSMCIVAALGGAALAARAYDLKEMTPPVKAAFHGRKARYADLKAFEKQGVVGENNRGYVTTLGAAAGAPDVVDAENADRKVIYKAIVQQNELADSDLVTVEKAFAQVRRNKAEPGEKVQDESGTWITK